MVAAVEARIESLDKSELYALFCIENKTRLVNVLVKMYFRLKDEKDLLFGLKEDETERLHTSLNISDIEKSIEDEFFMKVDKSYAKKKNKEFNSAEKVIAFE